MKIGITTNEILIPKKFFSARIDKELEFDTSIPDHCPDIARLIKVDCTPFTEFCAVEDGKGVIRGKAVYDVLYETDYKSRLRCCSFTQEFTLTATLPKTTAENASLFCDIRCERIDCKLIGSRRIVIRSYLGAMTEAECDVSAKAIAVEEDGEVFFLKKTVGFDGRTALHEETFKFSEEIPLNRNEKCINEIVCGSIAFQPPQVTVSSGRVDVKVTTSIHALCEEENNEGNYYMSSKTLPISIVYENEAIDDSKLIDVSLKPSDVSFIPEFDQYGENRIIRTDFSVKAQMKVNEPTEYVVAEDVFEKSHDGIIRSETIKAPKIKLRTANGFAIESKLPEPVPPATSILEATARDYGSMAVRSENGIDISGNFIITLLANTAEGIHSFDFPIPYRQNFQLNDIDPEDVMTATVFPIETIATLHSDGSISARVIAEAQINVTSETEETFVSEITKRTPRSSETDGSTFVFCYPEKKESLWSIAKHYRADPESILNSNPDRFDGDKNAIGREPILIKC